MPSAQFEKLEIEQNIIDDDVWHVILQQLLVSDMQINTFFVHQYHAFFLYYTLNIWMGRPFEKIPDICWCTLISFPVFSSEKFLVTQAMCVTN